ncbi:MAG: hypothetical protein RL027_619 [Pseudomonadota bacterium]|jgi:hypothetical protein
MTFFDILPDISMSLLNILQDIAIICYSLGSQITNRLGLVGVILCCIYYILKLFIIYF